MAGRETRKPVRRGEWSPLLLAVIIALLLLGILILFWARQGTGFMEFLQGLFGVVPTSP